MQTCKKTLALAIVSAVVSISWAQNSSYNSITSPRMPTISAPTMGSGFYLPGSVLNPIYMGNTHQEKPGVKEKAKVESKKKDVDAAVKRALGSVTASDMNVLSKMGLLDKLYSTADLSVLPYNSGNQTKDILVDVLTKIESIKTETQSKTPEARIFDNNSRVSLPVSNNAPTPSNVASSKIIRFSVNGYDILSTCRHVYISDVQSDGTFLVTGDRRYSTDGKTRKETFHLLFKKSADESGVSRYETATAVSQDYLNENSFLYQMSNMKGLKASRVGNLVTMRTDDKNWNLELLIDLGERK